MMLKEEVLKACRHFLGPIARLLLRSGVTWGEFSELSKEVFVDIARRDYGIRGRPTNTARVAMMTGLSRREVTRVRDVLLGARESEPAPANRISHILTGWHVDPLFCDSNKIPLVLPAAGEGPTLAKLFKRYAGDLPHGALTKELIQLGLVEQTDAGEYRVLRRDYIRQGADPDIVRQMGVALHDHAATLAHNLNSERKGPAYLERMASNTNVASRSAAAFMDLAEERGQAFLEEMDAWLSEHEASDPHKASRRSGRVGVGVYLFYEDPPKDRHS